MKCTSCGAEFNGAFCPYCGKRVTVAAPSAPAQPGVQQQAPVTPAPAAPAQANISANAQQQPPMANNPYAPPAAPAQGNASANVQQQTPPANNPYGAPPAPVNAAFQPAMADGGMVNQPKKKSKAPIIIGIAVGVIAIIAILVLCFFNTIVRAVAGETGYYLKQEVATVQELLDMDLEKMQKNTKVASDTKVSITGEEFDDETFQEMLEKITVYSAMDKKEDRIMIDAKGDFSGRTAEVKACLDESGLGVTAPGLADGAFYMELSQSMASLNQDELDKIVKELAPIIKEVEKEELANIITVKNEKVNGKNCRVVTYAFTEKVAYNALAALLEKAMANEDLKELLDRFIRLTYEKAYGKYQNYEYNNTPPTYEEFSKQFNDLPKELRKQAEKADDDYKVYYSIAYKGSRIVQRTLDDDGDKVVIDTDTSSSEKTLSVKYVEDGKDYELASFSNNGEDIHLSVNELDSNNSKIFELSIKNYKVENINGIYAPVFSLTCDIPEEDIYFTADAQKNDTYDLIVNIKDSGSYSEPALTVTLKNDLSDKPDFSQYTQPDKQASTDWEDFYEEVIDELYDVVYDD